MYMFTLIIMLHSQDRSSFFLFSFRFAVSEIIHWEYMYMYVYWYLPAPSIALSRNMQSDSASHLSPASGVPSNSFMNTTIGSIFDIALTFETNPVVSYTMYTHIGQAIPLQFCSGFLKNSRSSSTNKFLACNFTMSDFCKT